VGTQKWVTTPPMPCLQNELLFCMHENKREGGRRTKGRRKDGLASVGSCW